MRICSNPIGQQKNSNVSTRSKRKLSVNYSSTGGPKKKVSKPQYSLTNKSVGTLQKVINVFIKYMSNNINLLNDYIALLKKISTLNYERTCLIKFVKKLRFYNESLRHSTLFTKKLSNNHEHIETDEEQTLRIDFDEIAVTSRVLLLNSIFIKNLETLDILNFQLTRPIQNEVWSKTMNQNILIPEKNIVMIEDIYSHYVKFIQWMSETIGMHDSLFQLEIIVQSIKFAQEDINLNRSLDNKTNIKNDQHSEDNETENIFLQSVIPSNNEDEYLATLKQWLDILYAKNQQFEKNREEISNIWNGLQRTNPIKR